MPKTPSFSIPEAEIEQAAIENFVDLGYNHQTGAQITGVGKDRISAREVVLKGRFEEAVRAINATLPFQAQNSAVQEAQRRIDDIARASNNLIEANAHFNKLLRDGFSFEYQHNGTRSHQVRLLDFENLDNNDFLIVNQLELPAKNGLPSRRLDLCVFINGLPLGLIELKRPTEGQVTPHDAFIQLQNYKAQYPELMAYNAALAVSDGFEARIGSLSADWERFTKWHTINGETPSPDTPEMETLIRGVFERGRLFELIRFFTTFEKEENNALIKKIAAYHQFDGARAAVELAKKAVAGKRQGGVVWHTQGSGKSLTMLFYAAKLIAQGELNNPTIVVLTDRNDLDTQLFETFEKGADLLYQTPKQASSSAEMKTLLKVASGGVVFTTLQKFRPDEPNGIFEELTDRENVIVIADEAHRSQYGLIEGFARNLRRAFPNASFVAFTGTPIQETINLFGGYAHTYNIADAVKDKVTVPIYYEQRIAQLKLDPIEQPQIDPTFEEITEGAEKEEKEKLSSRWSQKEAIFGTPKRLKAIATDLVEHFEKRLQTLEGKAMVVCTSRRICADLYEQIIALRPEWHADEDNKGFVKVVMTSAADDPQNWQKHSRSEGRRKALAKTFKDPQSSIKLVIVRDMWLTGFDAPCLHTMYLDKEMQGHGLMQTIARVNRVYKDKPAGLVVDYLGLSNRLKDALNAYSKNDQGNVGIDQKAAIALMLDCFQTVQEFLEGTDLTPYLTGKASARLRAIQGAANSIRGRGEDEKDDFVSAVSRLTQAFALAYPSDEAEAIVAEVGFYQAVRLQIVGDRRGGGGAQSPEARETAVRQLVERAVDSSEVRDIFALTDSTHPDIAILDEKWLSEVASSEYKHLAVEAFRRLLKGQIAQRRRRNITEAKSFEKRLDEQIRAYHNRTLSETEVVEALLFIAREMNAAFDRGDKLGLRDDELAFYDALGQSQSAQEVLGDETLKVIARDLVEQVRKSLTIDWENQEAARANIRALVARILRKYGYPPDQQQKAVDTLLEQTKTLCELWVEDDTVTG